MSLHKIWLIDILRNSNGLLRAFGGSLLVLRDGKLLWVDKAEYVGYEGILFVEVLSSITKGLNGFALLRSHRGLNEGLEVNVRG